MSTKIIDDVKKLVNEMDFDATQYKNPLQRIDELEMAVHDLKVMISILHSKLYFCSEINKELNCGLTENQIKI